MAAGPLDVVRWGTASVARTEFATVPGRGSSTTVRGEEVERELLPVGEAAPARELIEDEIGDGMPGRALTIQDAIDVRPEGSSEGDEAVDECEFPTVAAATAAGPGGDDLFRLLPINRYKSCHCQPFLAEPR
ncbi:BQ5605_C019g09031 [Microbotryum silenes-dioicae]|uniref:BQ5605_C019g09031 protein n=1 Tax=Microbotryum silenes-dioicae TaxID=796604 RepID=A0A2X0MRA4_9BASI|nr:BQ5605_C019g09031 [Microbotryum silenes-dioicae]